MDDTTIVDLYMSRDEKAIEETSFKYGVKLKRIAVNILENEEDAEECENDTYYTAWKLIPPNEPRDYLFVFLAKITRNLSLNCCKRKNAKKRRAIFIELTKEMEECIEAPDNSYSKLSHSEIGIIISNFLRIQNKEVRDVFIRRYWFFDSISDIANDFNISESKVKSMLFRTRNNLRVYLKREDCSI